MTLALVVRRVEAPAVAGGISISTASRREELAPPREPSELKELKIFLSTLAESQRTVRRLKESSSLLSPFALPSLHEKPFTLSLPFREIEPLITRPVMATTAPAPMRVSLGAAAAAVATTTRATNASPTSPSSASDLAFQTALVLDWLAERSAGSDNADALVSALADAKVKGIREREREEKINEEGRKRNNRCPLVFFQNPTPSRPRPFSSSQHPLLQISASNPLPARIAARVSARLAAALAASGDLDAAAKRVQGAALSLRSWRSSWRSASAPSAPAAADPLPSPRLFDAAVLALNAALGPLTSLSSAAAQRAAAEAADAVSLALGPTALDMHVAAAAALSRLPQKNGNTGALYPAAAAASSPPRRGGATGGGGARRSSVAAAAAAAAPGSPVFDAGGGFGAGIGGGGGGGGEEEEEADDNEEDVSFEEDARRARARLQQLQAQQRQELRQRRAQVEARTRQLQGEAVRWSDEDEEEEEEVIPRVTAGFGAGPSSSALPRIVRRTITNAARARDRTALRAGEAAERAAAAAAGRGRGNRAADAADAAAPLPPLPFGRRNRRPSTPWTDDEVDCLREGVRRFGIGQWALILGNDAGRFNTCRSQVDLKDKWRNLERAAGRQPQHQRGVATAPAVPQQLDLRPTTEGGEQQQQQQQQRAAAAAASGGASGGAGGSGDGGAEAPPPKKKSRSGKRRPREPPASSQQQQQRASSQPGGGAGPSRSLASSRAALHADEEF